MVRFLTRYQYRIAAEKQSPAERMELLQRAIKEKKMVTITYLKAKDEKSRRAIKPLRVAKMEYEGHSFLGLEAYCLLRRANRIFNIEKILELSS